MIRFYFIKNISRLDSIKFNNINQQYNYFNYFIESKIDSIYPPHFQNRIQISIEDLSPSTKVNYLSLDFNEKTYYYFIDNINYINEGVYEIDITMDTIQTFLFDITINEGLLERYTIKRWNDDGSINRNYIRENLSNGDFFNYTTFDQNNKKCLIFKTRSEILTPNFNLNMTTNCYLQNIIDKSYTKLNDGTLYIILPIIDNFSVSKVRFKINYNNNYFTYDFGISLYYALINYLVESPYIVDAFICDNKFTNKLFTSNSYTDEEGRIIGEYLFRDGKSSLLNLMPNELTVTFAENPNIEITLPILREIYCDIDKTNISIGGFGINRYKNEKFSREYIPQLIDENYFRVNFGEKLGYTTYPLSKLKINKIDCISNYDIITGNRNYCILEKDNNIDTYLTLIINQTKESLALYSDRFQNYMSTNVGTLTTGVALARTNAVWSSTKQMMNIYNNNNTRLFSGNEFRNISNVITGVGDSFMSQYNITQQLKIARENAEYTPDTSRQGNSFSIDIMSSSLSSLLRIEMMNDIDYIAKKYEQYGFLVNQEINSDCNLYNNYFNTRYYFNVIKFKDVNITLDYICSNYLLQNIKERLQNGLRMWNVNDEIYSTLPIIDYNKFDYDNVENEYL